MSGSAARACARAYPRRRTPTTARRLIAAVSGPVTLSAVNGPLSIATIVSSLLLAGWAGVEALRDRPPSRHLLAGAAVAEVVVVALAGAAVIGLIGSDRPVEVPTFVGYLLMTVSMLPIGWVLARMEPTRWGTVTLMVTALVVPVLVMRLQQLWSAGGS